MTAAVPLRAPTPRLHHPSSTTADTLASSSSRGPSRVPSRAPTPCPSTRAPPPPPPLSSASPPPPPPPAPPPPLSTSRRPARPDPLSDRATSVLVRRVLCPPQQKTGVGGEKPIEELLPPLTSRNDVDLQLYGILAIVVREYIQSWYGRITADLTFVDEVVHVVAHCTRGLEQRLRMVDLESLIFDEVPDLLDRHITAYRTSRRAVARPPLEVSPRAVYHSLCPVTFLSPVPTPGDGRAAAAQEANESAYRQLVAQAVLAVLLPTEDLANPCLTSLVGQILSELVIGNVIADQLAQPWVVYEMLSLLARMGGREGGDGRGNVGGNRRARPEQPPRPGLAGGQSPEPVPEQDLPPTGWPGRRICASLLRWLLVGFATGRILVTAAIMSASLPPRMHGCRIGGVDGVSPHQNKSRGAESSGVPVLHFRAWPCISNLIELDERMPWLGGALSMVQLWATTGPWRIAGLEGPADRLLSHLIHTHVLEPALLPSLLRALRGAVFPSNVASTQGMTPPASEAELLALRRRCAESIGSALPEWVGRVYFAGGGGGGEGQGGVLDQIDESILDVFSDPYCNKHLVYGVLDLVLVRLLPELADKGVAELWDERLS